MVDAVGCYFHKTGWSPYNCSLFRVKNHNDFKLLQRDFENGSYLYHFGQYHPGKFTLEASRSAAPLLAGWANLKLFGREGLRVMLGHLVEVQINLRRRLHKQSTTVCVNPNNHGFVTLFRAYPRGVNAEQQYQRELTNPAYREQLQEHNKLQKAIATEMRKMLRENGENAPAISLTETYR
ncbi:MAG: aspartate aminotransferase family protein, partial [Candidatus Parabeggiatoa sp. nov. 2]